MNEDTFCMRQGGRRGGRGGEREGGREGGREGRLLRILYTYLGSPEVFVASPSWQLPSVGVKGPWLDPVVVWPAWKEGGGREGVRSVHMHMEDAQGFVKEDG